MRGRTSCTSRSITDPDAFEIVGDQLDLGPMVREDVLLELPSRRCAAPDCAGLCPTCGIDRNIADLRLRRRRRSIPRWAALEPAQGESAATSSRKRPRVPLTSRSSFRQRKTAVAVPKKKKSKSKTRSHRAGAWKLVGTVAQRLPALRRRQAAAHGVPGLRLVQGPRRRRRRLINTLSMLPIAVDAMGGDRAPARSSPVLTLRPPLGIPVVLVGPADLEGRGDLALIEASEVIAMDEDAGAGRAPQEGLHARARRRGGARRQGVGDGLGRQHRRHDGVGAAAHGPDQGRQPPGDRHPDPGARARRPTILLDAGANAEVQPEWLVQFAQMGSVYARHRFGIDAPDGRPAVDRRGARQGRHAAQGGVRAARRGARASTSSATSRAAT